MSSNPSCRVPHGRLVVEVVIWARPQDSERAIRKLGLCHLVEKRPTVRFGLRGDRPSLTAQRFPIAQSALKSVGSPGRSNWRPISSMQICPCGKDMFPNVAPPARSCFLATSPKDSARASSAQKPVSRQSYGLNAARLCVKSQFDTGLQMLVDYSRLTRFAVLHLTTERRLCLCKHPRRSSSELQPDLNPPHFPVRPLPNPIDRSSTCGIVLARHS
jgi:hypothetical protein